MADEVMTTGSELAATVDSSDLTATAPDTGGMDATAPDLDTSSTGASDSEIDPELLADAPDVPGLEDEDVQDALADEPAAEEAKPDPAQPDDLPEGVEQKITREGKKKFYLPEQVFTDFRSAADLRGKLAEIIGEDVTPEAVQDRQNALLAQERLYGDLLSGDPVAQGNVVAYFMDQAREALATGKVASDPMLSLADSFLDAFQKGHPDADARVLTRSARRVFDDIYSMAADMADGRSVEELQQAATAGDKSAKEALNLLYSVQHLDRKVFKNFRKAEEIKPRTSDPLAEERARIQSERAELDKRQTAAASERWTQWQGNTRASVRTAVDSTIDTALADVKGQYAKFPNVLKQVTEGLKAKVLDGIKSDSKWNELVAIETNKAKRAASDQIRQQLADSIVNRHANKAKQIIAAHKAALLREAVSGLKAQSDATHARRAAAEQHRAPGGGGTPVKRSLAPVPGKMGNYDVASRDNLLSDLAGLTLGR